MDLTLTRSPKDEFRFCRSAARLVTQAQTVVSELKRLSESALHPGIGLLAPVVTRAWRYLDPVRSLCELEGITGADGERGVLKRLASAGDHRHW